MRRALQMPQALQMRRALRSFSTSAPVVLHEQSKVGCIGLGNMGSVLAARIADVYSDCMVYDIDPQTVKSHAVTHGTAGSSSIAECITSSQIVVVCLPNSKLVQLVVDEVLSSESIEPGTIFLDCTSGNMEQSQLFERQLNEKGVFYVDCAVSGGPAGARKGILTSFIGGNPAAVSQCESVISTFSKKLVNLGPAGAGHATKSVNNILLATQNWAISEGMAVLKKNGVDLHQALEAINESSGRSWSSMQRMPDNILTQKFDYGFSVGLHRKDCEAACSLMRTEEGMMITPLLNQTRLMMNLAVNELGPEADHTQVAQLVEKWNGVKLQ